MERDRQASSSCSLSDAYAQGATDMREVLGHFILDYLGENSTGLECGKLMLMVPSPTFSGMDSESEV
jgi:hypothetical protein